MHSVAPCTLGWRAQRPVTPSTASWPILSFSPSLWRRLASPPSWRPEKTSTPSPAPPLGRQEEESHPAPSPAAASYPSELLLLLPPPLPSLHQHHMSCHQLNCRTEEGSHHSAHPFILHAHMLCNVFTPSVIPATLCFSCWLWHCSACKFAPPPPSPPQHPRFSKGWSPESPLWKACSCPFMYSFTDDPLEKLLIYVGFRSLQDSQQHVVFCTRFIPRNALWNGTELFRVQWCSCTYASARLHSYQPGLVIRRCLGKCKNVTL